MDLKGSKTEANLKEAFAGESQARNKYTYFASAAKKEGFEQIAAVFLETAEQEKTHAKLHFQALAGIGSTLDNLKAAAAGENEETTEMYPRMAREAHAVLATHAGPEIGVASTKAFTTQLVVLACFAIALAKARGKIDAAKAVVSA